MQKILIYDTTLRDGSQGENISFSLEDKLHIVKKLDDLGLDYVEGGWPGEVAGRAGWVEGGEDALAPEKGVEPGAVVVGPCEFAVRVDPVDAG